MSNLEGTKFETVKQIQAPKVYSACISAQYHHSGHHNQSEESKKYSQENTHYTTINPANLCNSGGEVHEGSPIFNFGHSSLEEEEQGSSTPYFYIQTLHEKTIQKVYTTSLE